MPIVTHIIEKDARLFINKIKWLNDIPEYSEIVSFDAVCLHLPYEKVLKNDPRIPLDSER